MSLLKSLSAVGTLNKKSVLLKEYFATPINYIDTGVPILNLFFSGKLDGGYRASGLTQIAGESRHFKTNIGLAIGSAFLADSKENIMLFYDNEGGARETYFESFGIDADQVLHVRFSSIEEMTADLSQKIDYLEKNTDDKCKVMIFIDSIGSAASKKEINDALENTGKEDMTRAKKLGSLWRILTPHLLDDKFCCIAVNHTYNTMEMYASKVLSGGQKNMLASNEVMFIGKRQVKTDKTLDGYDFMLNAEKSRTIKEKSVLPLRVTFAGGIDKFSGLLEIAQITGHITKPSNGWYIRPAVKNDKKWREKETRCNEFWNPLLKDKTFLKAVSELYILGATKMINDGSQTVNDTILIDEEAINAIED